MFRNSRDDHWHHKNLSQEPSLQILTLSKEGPGFPMGLSFSGHFCPEEKSQLKSTGELSFHLNWKLGGIPVHPLVEVEMTMEECRTWLGEKQLPKGRDSLAGHTHFLQVWSSGPQPRWPGAGSECAHNHINGPLSWVGLSWTSSHHHHHNPFSTSSSIALTIY